VRLPVPAAAGATEETRVKGASREGMEGHTAVGLAGGASAKAGEPRSGTGHTTCGRPAATGGSAAPAGTAAGPPRTASRPLLTRRVRVAPRAPVAAAARPLGGAAAGFSVAPLTTGRTDRAAAPATALAWAAAAG